MQVNVSSKPWRLLLMQDILSVKMNIAGSPMVFKPTFINFGHSFSFTLLN